VITSQLPLSLPGAATHQWMSVLSRIIFCWWVRVTQRKLSPILGDDLKGQAAAV
jgi:hypothetical protein